MKRQDRTFSRRQDITAAALACFVNSGFHRTSMRDIAKAAGVSLGNVYNHFENKEALVAEIAALEMEELAPLLAQLHAGESLQAFLAAYLALCRQPDNVMLTSEIIAEAARNPALAKLFSANRARLVSALADAIARSAQAGAVDDALPVTALAELLLDAVEGQALREALFSNGDADGGAALLALLGRMLEPRAPAGAAAETRA